MPKKADYRPPIDRLATKDPQSDAYNAVIETPKGSQNKFKYEPGQGYFRLHRVLPAGTVFPYDFGFIPGTLGEDGDPLDVLILMDRPAYPGTVTDVRVIGVIEAEQTENGQTIRNDRLVAVNAETHNYENLQSIKDMDQHLLDEVEHFFISYDEMEGKTFKPIGRYGPRRAIELIEAGVKALKKRNKG